MAGTCTVGVAQTGTAAAALLSTVPWAQAGTGSEAPASPPCRTVPLVWGSTFAQEPGWEQRHTAGEEQWCRSAEERP